MKEALSRDIARELQVMVVVKTWHRFKSRMSFETNLKWVQFWIIGLWKQLCFFIRCWQASLFSTIFLWPKSTGNRPSVCGLSEGGFGSTAVRRRWLPVIFHSKEGVLDLFVSGSWIHNCQTMASLPNNRDLVKFLLVNIFALSHGCDITATNSLRHRAENFSKFSTTSACNAHNVNKLALNSWLCLFHFTRFWSVTSGPCCLGTYPLTMPPCS